MKQLFLFFIVTIFTVTGIAQNVGIGTTTPGYPLDVNGRMRLRYNGSTNTAGIWFNNSSNIATAFTGMYNDTIIGFFGNDNWRVGIDFKNTRLGIGTMTPAAKLDIAGSIKITDGTQAAGKVLTSDADGKAAWAVPQNSNTGFRAAMAKTSVSSGSAVSPNNWDVTSFYTFADAPFDRQLGVFRAPNTGLYHFDLSIQPDKAQTQTPTVNGT